VTGVVVATTVLATGTVPLVEELVLQDAIEEEEWSKKKPSNLIDCCKESRDWYASRTSENDLICGAYRCNRSACLRFKSVENWMQRACSVCRRAAGVICSDLDVELVLERFLEA